MPQLLYYYNIFHKKDIINNKWKKVVPLELKYNFNAIYLAHLIMGDGNYLSERNIIRIYTNSFTKENVDFLSNIIYSNLYIKNKVIHDRNNQYIIIIIEKEYINYTREIILPYMHPSMLYKLGLKEDNISFNKFDYFNIIYNI
jgi:LAGLIDADG DNA endonuclease family